MGVSLALKNTDESYTDDFEASSARLQPSAQPRHRLELVLSPQI